MKAMINNVKSRISEYKKTKHLIFEDLAFLFLCIVLIFVPFSGYVIKRALYAAILFLLIAKGIVWKCEKTPFISRHFMNWPWLIFIVALALANSFSPDAYESWKFFAERVLMYILAFWATKELLLGKVRVKILVGSVVATAAVVGLDCVWQFFMGKDLFFGHPLSYMGKALTGPLARHNYLSGYLEMAVPFVVFIAFAKRKLLKCSVLILVAASLIFSLIFAYERGVLLSVFAAVFFTAFFLKKRLVLLAPVIAIIVFFLLPHDFRERFTSYIDFNTTATERGVEAGNNSGFLKKGWSNGRVYMWKTTYEMFKQKPITGHGLHAYNRYYKSRKDRKLACSYAHNAYLQLSAEAGILGISTFLFLILVYLIKMVSCVCKVKDYNQRTVLCAFIASSITTVISGLYSPNMLVGIGFSLMFWIIMAAGSNIAAYEIKTS